jgi:hypothetical protein
VSEGLAKHMPHRTINRARIESCGKYGHMSPRASVGRHP